MDFVIEVEEEAYKLVGKYTEPKALRSQDIR
jgi:hypothetical protein